MSSNLNQLDCLQIDSECFILFAGIDQILLKIYFIHILITFIYLVALYQKTISSQTRTELIIVADNCSKIHHTKHAEAKIKQNPELSN